jgi:probable H4MPT-linked C1 transfer pathway protein
VNTEILGWDIGGAHVKAALLDDSGKIMEVFLQPCPLWKGLAYLEDSVNHIKQLLPCSVHYHAITMTGEMVDLFANRDDGVRQIINTLTKLLPGSALFFFAGLDGFIEATKLDSRHYQSCASANWLASAMLVAAKIGTALFVDIGSTTTDILLLQDGKPITEAYSDYLRLQSQELVYTGIVRTAVMAVAQTAVDKGQEIGIMAEYFATMADVYRVTGELDEAHDKTETADGAEKTLTASSRRLMRMIACDFNPSETSRWRSFAENIRYQQIRKIQAACEYRLTVLDKARSLPLVGAGIGRFLAKEIARSLHMDYIDFSEFFEQIPASTKITTADCAPAVAVAILLKTSLLADG